VFFVFCVYDNAAACGQSLALSKAWESSFIDWWSRLCYYCDWFYLNCSFYGSCVNCKGCVFDNWISCWLLAGSLRMWVANRRWEFLTRSMHNCNSDLGLHVTNEVFWFSQKWAERFDLTVSNLRIFVFFSCLLVCLFVAWFICCYRTSNTVEYITVKVRMLVCGVQQLYAKCTLSLESAYYNDKVVQWESLIEPVQHRLTHKPWQLTIEVCICYVL